MLADSDKIEQYLTRDEAKQKIRRAPFGTQFYLSLTVSVPIAPEGEFNFPTGGRIHLQLSRAKIQEAVGGAFGDTLEDRGGRVRVYWWEKHNGLYVGN